MERVAGQQCYTKTVSAVRGLAFICTMSLSDREQQLTLIRTVARNFICSLFVSCARQLRCFAARLSMLRNWLDSGGRGAKTSAHLAGNSASQVLCEIPRSIPTPYCGWKIAPPIKRRVGRGAKYEERCCEAGGPWRIRRMGESSSKRRQDDGRVCVLLILTERKARPSRFPWWRRQQMANRSPLASSRRSIGRLRPRKFCEKFLEVRR
jgi:hypothetical protein